MKRIINESQLRAIVKEAVSKVLNETSHRQSTQCKPMLSEVYVSTTNKSDIVTINETNAKRLLDKHTSRGYAIISACRGRAEFGLGDTPDDTRKFNEINQKRTRELVKDIQNAGFSYTLCYGGFIENLGEEDEENVYERSVIVYATKRDGSDDVDALRNFAIEECRKFNQDSVLICLPDGKPQYIKQDGTIDFELGGEVAFNDIAQTYFTDLHKNTQSKIKPESKPTRFSFLECYIAPKPMGLSEMHIRELKGEVFLKR